MEPAEWKPFERGGADILIDASGIAGREAIVQACQFRIVFPWMWLEKVDDWWEESIGCQARLENPRWKWGPENLDKVVHLDILFCPPVKFGVWIIALVTGNVLRRPGGQQEHLLAGYSEGLAQTSFQDLERRRFCCQQI